MVTIKKRLLNETTEQNQMCKYLINSATNNQNSILRTHLDDTYPKVRYSVNIYRTYPSPSDLIWKIESTTYIFSIAWCIHLS